MVIMKVVVFLFNSFHCLPLPLYRFLGINESTTVQMKLMVRGGKWSYNMLPRNPLLAEVSTLYDFG